MFIAVMTDYQHIINISEIKRATMQAQMADDASVAYPLSALLLSCIVTMTIINIIVMKHTQKHKV